MEIGGVWYCKMKILVDTNFLVLNFTSGIDIFEEIKYTFENPQIIIFDTVLDELKKIKPAVYNSVVEILKMKKIKSKPVQTELTVDDFLVEYAEKYDCAIATLDRELKQKALKRGLSVISIRGKKLYLR